MTNWILKLLWYSPLVPGTVGDSTYRPVEEELYICLCSGWAIVSDKNFIIMGHLNEMLFDDDYYDWCNVPTCLLYLYYTPASFPEWFSIIRGGTHYTVLFGPEGHSNQSSSYLLLFLCRHVRNCVMMVRTTFTYWLPPPPLLLFHFLSALLYSSCALNGQHLICGPPIKLLLKPFRNSSFPRNFFKSISSP